MTACPCSSEGGCQMPCSSYLFSFYFCRLPDRVVILFLSCFASRVKKHVCSLVLYCGDAGYIRLKCSSLKRQIWLVAVHQIILINLKYLSLSNTFTGLLPFAALGFSETLPGSKKSDLHLCASATVCLLKTAQLS